MFYEEQFPERVTGSKLDDYLARGWFRMRSYIFTTSHLFEPENDSLSKVWWLRFRVNEIGHHKSHKDIRRLNRPFRVEFDKLFALTAVDMLLFEQYRKGIRFTHYHRMEDCFYSHAKTTVYESSCFRIYDGDKQIALAVFDLGANSAASILHIYDHHYSNCSTGKYMMLLTVDNLKNQGYQYYYPGYIVSGRSSYNYKLDLGKEAAYYYEPEVGDWLPFKSELLKGSNYTEDEVLDYYFLVEGKKKQRVSAKSL